MGREKMKVIFLICPVRGPEDEITKRIANYVAKLEREKHVVYWPYRDTNQNDSIGLRICTDNTRAMRHTNEVHIWWDKTASGVIFDFGMAFMFYALYGKKIILANPEEVKPTEQKSFNNVLLAIHSKNSKGEEK